MYVAPGNGAPDERLYCFDIVKTHSGYRAYIVKTPKYRNRNTDASHTHRLYDGRHYVCWTNRVNSLADMKAIATHWSNCTRTYIEKGISF